MDRCLLAFAALTLIACSAAEHQAPNSQAVQELQTIRTLKVYFGHQSVGANILEGLREIERQAGGGPILTDVMIGQNGDPASKCEDFSRKFAALRQRPDVALMKFCYMDFNQVTDAEKLLGRYAATIDRLQTEYPDVTFIPVTAPLTTVPPDWKRMLKHTVGMGDTATALNATRLEFNRLLRNRYEGRTIFDLAWAESTTPSGESTASLVDAYSSDGGHLNALGSRVVAEHLIHTLAVAARARSARSSPTASAADSMSR